MDNNLTIYVDLAVCAFIMFFLIGQRFNQWPDRNRYLLSGKPIDYIDPFRFFAFYAIYISTFLLIAVAVYNLQLPLSEKLQPNTELSQLLETLGSHSWTVAALYLLALVNEKHVGKWDAVWRNHLQMWARIPKAVLDMKSGLLFSEMNLTPTNERLEDLRSVLKKAGMEAYWEPKLDQWEQERQSVSVAWQYIKAMYALRICKEYHVATLSANDIKTYEGRLKDIGYLIPRLEKEDEGLKSHVEELNKVYAYCVESLTKHLIKKYPSKKNQRDALRRLGYFAPIYDVPKIKILKVSICCVLCIAIVCFITIAAYLALLDAFGRPFRGTESWLTWERFWGWSRGSIISYAMAIFVAVIIDKTQDTNDVLPRFVTYIITLLFSTLVSLSFFHFNRSDPNHPLNWLAYISLALSMGVASIAVILVLNKSACEKQKEVLLSALGHAVLLGLMSGLFMTVASLSFRGGFDKITLPGIIITILYGFVRGGAVVFLVSYLIQESIRLQLLIAQRQYPRRAYKSRLSAVVDAESITLTTRDISLGGLLIEPRRRLKAGQIIDLNFSFGPMKAKVQWATRKLSGLAFDEGTPNNEKLRQFIQDNFGPEYA